MYLNSSSLLLLGGALLSYYLIHSFPQLLLKTGVNLWKSVINAFQNAIINIPLLSILFHKGVNKGVLICGINVILGSDLSERSITRTRYNYKTLGVIILE